MRTQRTDSMTECQRLSLTCDDDDDFPTVQNGAYADSQRHPRYFGDIPLKETCIREYSVVRESFDTCTRNERRPRFVERNMPILADTAQEEFDPAVRPNSLFVRPTFADEVFGVSVEDVDLGGGDVDVGEEFAEHECVV